MWIQKPTLNQRWTLLSIRITFWTGLMSISLYNLSEITDTLCLESPEIQQNNKLSWSCWILHFLKSLPNPFLHETITNSHITEIKQAIGAPWQPHEKLQGIIACRICWNNDKIIHTFYWHLFHCPGKQNDKSLRYVLVDFFFSTTNHIHVLSTVGTCLSLVPGRTSRFLGLRWEFGIITFTLGGKKTACVFMLVHVLSMGRDCISMLLL